MSELISGKEALIALANGDEVENFNGSTWWSVDESWEVGAFLSDRKFRLKPRTITINGIKAPAPFKPKDDDVFYHILPSSEKGYGWCYGEDETMKQFGAWRTEEEIKQVITALRKIFND